MPSQCICLPEAAEVSRSGLISRSVLSYALIKCASTLNCKLLVHSLSRTIRGRQKTQYIAEEYYPRPTTRFARLITSEVHLQLSRLPTPRSEAQMNSMASNCTLSSVRYSCATPARSDVPQMHDVCLLTVDGPTTRPGWSRRVKRGQKWLGSDKIGSYLINLKSQAALPFCLGLCQRGPLETRGWLLRGWEDTQLCFL
jgi:hypothetical protein